MTTDDPIFVYFTTLEREIHVKPIVTLDCRKVISFNNPNLIFTIFYLSDLSHKIKNENL